MVDICLLKVNSRNTSTRSEICSKLTKRQENDAVGVVNFEHISYLVLVFLL